MQRWPGVADARHAQINFLLRPVALASALLSSLAPAQQFVSTDQVPSNFRADAEFAARIRPVLLPYTEPASPQFAIGDFVLNTLLKQLPVSKVNYSWELRIAKDAGNVFSSPDGTIYVDEALAQALGSQSGLWAAVLSHEVAHVARRDWGAAIYCNME